MNDTFGIRMGDHEQHLLQYSRGSSYALNCRSRMFIPETCQAVQNCETRANRSTYKNLLLSIQLFNTPLLQNSTGIQDTRRMEGVFLNYVILQTSVPVRYMDNFDAQKLKTNFDLRSSIYTFILSSVLYKCIRYRFIVSAFEYNNGRMRFLP